MNINKSKAIAIIFAIFMAIHEVIDIIQGNHKEGVFKLVDFSDNVTCNPVPCEIPDCLKDVPDCTNGIDIIGQIGDILGASGK